MTAEEHKAKVRRVIDEVFQKGNMNAWDEITAPDVVYHHPLAPDVKGLEAYKRRMEDFRKAFSDLRFTIHEWAMEKGTSAFRYTMQGTHTGQLPNSRIPPTGKRVTMTGVSIVRLKDGKVWRNGTARTCAASCSNSGWPPRWEKRHREVRFHPSHKGDR